MEHKEKKTMTYDVRNPGHGYRHEYNCAVLNRLMGSQSSRVWLNSVHREILSSVIIVFYDKVRGRNKAQRWLILVCWGFFIWKRYNRTQFHRTLLCLTPCHGSPRPEKKLIVVYCSWYYCQSLWINLFLMLPFSSLFSYFFVLSNTWYSICWWYAV